MAAGSLISIISATAAYAAVPASDPVVPPAVQSEANAIAMEVETVLPAELRGDDVNASKSSGVFKTFGNTAVTIPSTASQKVVATKAGVTVGVGTGTTTATTGVLAEQGSVVYNATGSVDRSVQATDDGFRIHTVIRSAAAPTEYTHAVTLPSGTHLAMASSLPTDAEDPGRATGTADGVLIVRDADNALVAGFSSPWARDAHGVAVATRFEVRNGALVQIVDHATTSGVVYPVVADPYLGFSLIKSYTWAYTTGSGYTLRAYPTAWARAHAGSYYVGTLGFKELQSKTGGSLNTNVGGMRDQYICHQQWVAIWEPSKASWNLDEWRPDVSYYSTVRARCNP